MSAPCSTIKKFYSPCTSSLKQDAPPKGSSPPRAPAPDNSFASSERAANITSSPLSKWSPEHDYEEVSIRDLCPGPRWATFTCRVINIYDQAIESKMPQSAKGCLKILVKDDTATVLIKLWYASTTYDLRLGTLLTCWTTHIHSTTSLAGINEVVTLPSSPIMTSIFPERDNGCQVRIHNEEAKLNTLFRTPLGYFSGDPLSGFMSLDQYMNHGGNEIPEARLLVCVTAIGVPTTITTKTGTTFRTLAITIADTTTSATLALSAPLFSSAQSWTKNDTILLLSSPRFRGTRLSLTSRSYVDVDPTIPEAVALRRYAQQENGPANRPFPDEIFDAKSIESAAIRLQFTFYSLIQFVDDNLEQNVSGYLSVILTQVNIVELVLRKKLFSMECCGMPLYANKIMGTCGQCGDRVELRVNPDVVMGVADESGGIAGGGGVLLGIGANAVSRANSRSGARRKAHSKLLWSDEAWCQLLGRGAAELAEFCREDVSAERKKENEYVLRYLEQRLQWMRVVLLVGWIADVGGGRVAVLQVVA